MTAPLVLVADDNAVVVEMLRAALGAEGMEVRGAADGEEAVRLAHDLEPDLIVLDLLMPKLDGLSVLARLRGDPALKTTPVLVVTGMASDEVEEIALAYDAVALLAKPFKMGEIAARVRALLSGRASVA